MNLNSTSNDTLPLLWQVPGFNLRKKRFSDDDVASAAANAYGNDYDDRSSSGYDDGDGGFDLASVLGGFGGGGSLSLGELGSRVRDGLLLYSLAQGSPECRRKIACVFGAEARRLPGRRGAAVAALVSRYAPAQLADFRDEFLRAARSDGPGGGPGAAQCAHMKCSKCFSI